MEAQRRERHPPPEVTRPSLPRPTPSAGEGPMATTVPEAPRARTRPARRHPLVAAAIVLPLAALLVVVFGGWEAVVLQASSVGMMP
ncbi:hypothetical protein STTU_5807 [Streptomyces sp. Tu6071]|nr:hypothetical protein STTU_5807 [Streptomyces sp. Tu6071]